MDNIGTSVQLTMICVNYPLVGFTVWKLHGLMKRKLNNDNNDSSIGHGINIK